MSDVAPPTKDPKVADAKRSKLEATENQTAQDEEDSETIGGTNRFLLFNAVPSWMVSFLFHIALILILALSILKFPLNNEIQLSGDLPIDAAVEDVGDINLDVSETDALDSDITEVSEPTFEAESEQMTFDMEPVLETSTFMVDDASNFDADESSEFSASDIADETSSRSDDGRERQRKRNGGTPASEKAVQMALEWLKKHQLPDGGWSLDHTFGQGKFRKSPDNGDPGYMPEARNGATALALLPFLGNGKTHLQGKYKQVVRRGLEFLMDRSVRQGRGLSFHEPGGSMYSHGLCSIVFGEAYAMTKDSRLAPYAQGSIWFIEDAQDPVGGGWRYIPREAGDTSVVGWQVMGLKSGKLSGLSMKKRTYKLTSKFLDSVSIRSGGIYGYTDRPREAHAGHRARTAVGLLCRMYMGWEKSSAGLANGVEWMSDLGPDRGDSGGINMYYNYYATQVMMHYGGDTWKQWNSKMRDFLVRTQSQQGDSKGSWYFGQSSHAAEAGGRLYVTALSCMTLEVYYRYLPIYSKEAAEDDFPLD